MIKLEKMTAYNPDDRLKLKLEETFSKNMPILLQYVRMIGKASPNNESEPAYKLTPVPVKILFPLL